MEDLHCSRKIDSMGRITLPIRLRERLGFKIGEKYDFYLEDTERGKYLCIRCPEIKDANVIDAIDMLEELGYEITPGSY